MANSSLSVAQVLDLLAATPARLATVSDRLTPEQLRTAPAPDEWSAVDVLAHLRSCADVWGDSMRRIVTEDGPTLRAINPRTWIKRTNYRELEFRPSLAAFAAQRAELLAALEHLSPEDWSRSATVTGAGRVLERTVWFYGQWLASHERPHVRQIERLVDALRA
ncbi:MAG TPA: DinB family protein [Thermomicrobiaceae bacterium]|nr:DinB family protein [Thermomicrobiaceae bacterium]